MTKDRYLKAKEVLLATLELGIIVERTKKLEPELIEKIEELNLHLTEIFMDDYIELQPTYEPNEHSFRTGLRWKNEFR